MDDAKRGYSMVLEGLEIISRSKNLSFVSAIYLELTSLLISLIIGPSLWINFRILRAVWLRAVAIANRTDSSSFIDAHNEKPH